MQKQEADWFQFKEIKKKLKKKKKERKWKFMKMPLHKQAKCPIVYVII